MLSGLSRHCICIAIYDWTFLIPFVIGFKWNNYRIERITQKLS